MLWTIVGVLVVLWLLGFTLFHIGPLIGRAPFGRGYAASAILRVGTALGRSCRRAAVWRSGGTG
jgi:hypothetical protein